MSSSDLFLTAISFLGGLITSATIGWIFFRAQQKTDFNKFIVSIKQFSQATDSLKSSTNSRLRTIEKNLRDIRELMGRVNQSTDIVGKIDSSKEISSLKELVNRLVNTLDT